jgi:transposase InsO family protein
MIYSDQGSQFTSREWQTFLRQHNLDASMGRRGNGRDQASEVPLVQAQWRGPSLKASSSS